MDLSEPLLESWNRQCRILSAVGSRVDEENRKAKPSEEGWTLDRHLAHVHEVRYGWLKKVSPAHVEDLGETFLDDWETPVESLATIKAELDKSGLAIRAAMRELLAGDGAPVGGYDHPVLFLQHMIWHEGWHVGLLMLGLRLAGQEPPEEWEEARVWGEWRTE